MLTCMVLSQAWQIVDHYSTEENQEMLHFPRLGLGRWDRPLAAQLLLGGSLAETVLNSFLVG